MPRQSKSPAERARKTAADLNLLHNAVSSALKALEDGDQAKLTEAAKFIEAVGCYARRTAVTMPAQAAQRVTIIGPNLRDQSKGQFHVHAEGCADIAKAAKRDPEFRNGWTIEAADRVQVCDEVYPPEDFDCESGEHLGEFHFAPCVKLPVSS